NFKDRTMSTTLDAPQLQWTDRVARSLGNEYTNLSLSGAAAGPIVFDKAFYNVAYQLGRRSNDLQTLLNTDPAGLQAAGISADSVARLTSLLRSTNVPADYLDLPGSRLNDQASILGSFDFSPPSSTRGDAWNVTFNGGWTKSNPVTDFFGGSSSRA